MTKENAAPQTPRWAKQPATQIDTLAGEEAYKRAERQALALLDQGFYLGGVIRASRDDWHER
jgi:hypothetical protein